MQARELTKQMARNDTAVKIDAQIVTQARTVATRRAITVAEYLSELLRASVAKDYRQAVKEMAAEIDGLKPTKATKGGA